MWINLHRLTSFSFRNWTVGVFPWLILLNCSNTRPLKGSSNIHCHGKECSSCYWWRYASRCLANYQTCCRITRGRSKYLNRENCWYILKLWAIYISKSYNKSYYVIHSYSEVKLSKLGCRSKTCSPKIACFCYVIPMQIYYIIIFITWI